MLDEYKDEKSDFVEDEEVNENSDNEKDKDARENKGDRDDENDENYNDKKNDRDYEEVKENNDNKEDRNDKEEKDDEEISDLDEHRDIEVENEDEKYQKIDNVESEMDEEGDFGFLYNNDFNIPVENEENFEKNPENEDDIDFSIDEDLEIEPDLDNSSENKELKDGEEEEESEPDFDELFENKFDVDQEILEESDDLSATVEEEEEEGEESEPDFDDLFKDNDWLTTKLKEELHEIPELLHNDVQEHLIQTEKNFDHLYNEDNYNDLDDNKANSLKNSDIGDEKDNNEEQQIIYFNHLFGDDFGLSSNSDLVNQQDYKDTYYKNFVEFQEMDKFLTKTINSLNNNKENEIDFKYNEENFKDFENFFKQAIEYPQFFKNNPSRINSESLDELKKHFHDIDKGDINSTLFSIRDGKIFFYPGYIGCSDLKVKYLKPNAVKNELHNDLKELNYYLPFSTDSIPKKEGGEIPKVLIDTLKTTSDLHKMWQMLEPAPSNMEKYDKWFYSKPNHNAIEKFLYNKFPKIIAIETPVWSKPLRTTGHIDFLMFDDKTLYVMDYKPEAANGKEYKFIQSIPQVSMYGKLIKEFVPDDIDVKCVSFCKDSGWIYDPNKIKDVLPAQIEKYIKKPEFLEQLAWIPLAKDKPAPFKFMAQARVNDYFNTILKNKSQQPYRKKFRKVLHNLKISEKIPPGDMNFLGKALKKNFNLIKDDVSEYITEYKKKFKSKELYTEFLNNIGKGMLLPECSQNYFSSKNATLDKDSLLRLFYYYKGYARAIINNKNIDRMSLIPYTREIFDNVAKNSKEELMKLDKIWKSAKKGAAHVPIDGYPNISSYIYDKMEKGEDLTKMFRKIKNISTQESLPNTIIYFKNRIRNFFNQDRERAQKLYNIPISPKQISVSVDKEGNVKISGYKHLIPCIKEIEGMSSKKFFIKNLEENKTPKEIIEYLKNNIPKSDLSRSFNNFIHQFREWSKSHPQYMLNHFGIPIDVPYQIKPKDDLTVPVEIRIKDFCNKRLNQGVPIETFAKTALDQVPEQRRKVKWHQICNHINSFARNNPELFQKHYGIKVDEYFRAADHLNSHINIGFKKRKRKYKIPTKYAIEGLQLKQFIQNQIDNYPKQDIRNIFNKILALYPENRQEIRTTIGRCAKEWISDNPTHHECKNVANSLEKFQTNFKKSPTKIKLLKDILANNEIEKCKQNYAKNTLTEKSTKKTVNQHTLNTTISRMKRIIKHRIKNPSANFDDLKLISKRCLSKSALNMILATPIKDLKKLKIIEKKENMKEITKEITTLPKMKTDLPKSEQILMQHYIQEKYVNTGMKEQTITETKRGILQFYDFLRKISPKIQEISKISYDQYQQYDKFLKEDLKLTKKAYTNYSNQIQRYLNYSIPDFSKWHSESQQKQKQPALQNDRNLIETFINEKFVLPGKSKNSISKANSALKNYCEFIKKQQPDLKNIENAKNSQINEFKTYLMKDKNYSSETIRKQKQVVQNFLQFNNLLEFQDKITNIKLYITQQIKKHTDLSSMMTNILKQTPDAQKQTKITTCKRYIHNTFKKFPEIAENIYEFENSPNTIIKIDTTGKVSIYIR